MPSITKRDEDLAEEFTNAQDDTAVKDFWHTSASPKKLHARIMELGKASGFNDVDVEGLTAFRRQEYEILSQSSHLSFVGAVLTVHTPKLGEPEAIQRGPLGGANDFSIRTLQYAIFATWHFCRFAYGEIVTKDELGLVRHDAKDEWHVRLFVGREVFSDIVMKYWSRL